MPYDNKRPRRPGGGRPPGARNRDFGDRPPRERGSFGDRPPPSRDFGDRPPRERGGYADRPPARTGYGERGGAGRPPRRDDDGGMSIRLDPRRLSALKLLASEAGVRPGELVTHWVEERLDAARAGGPAAAATSGAALVELQDRVATLERRIDALGAAGETSGAASGSQPSGSQPSGKAPARRRGRPPKAATPRRAAASGSRVALHDEIAAVIEHRGPSSAAEIAAGVVERGRYTPPRSSKPIDASIINSRVSNPVYRARFTRHDGKIGLATSTATASE